MIFVPSQEIHDRLHFELAGVFIDRALTAPHRWLVAKLPTNLIREVRAGAALSLKVWLVAIADQVIPAFGLTVHDDKTSPRTFFGSCRNDAEADDLWAVLAAGVFPIQFHNENCAPLLYAECRVDPEACRAVLAKRPTPAVPGDRGFELRERANDAVDASLRGGDDRILAACDVRVMFTQTHTIRVLFPGLGEVDLTDADEGGELERLTFRAFETLFPFGTFINPRVGEGAKRRELCDVLAVARVREVGNEGVFVIQNKVASAFPEGLKRTTARRARSIQKNILSGIAQLEGAIKALRAGEAVYRADGTSVELDPSGHPDGIGPLGLSTRAAEIGQGVVVISDMHEGVDWERVFYALGRVFLSTRYYCHVLDLQELARLIVHSRGRAALLEGLLIQRGQEMLKNKTALIRYHFVGGKR